MRAHRRLLTAKCDETGPEIQIVGDGSVQGISHRQNMMNDYGTECVSVDSFRHRETHETARICQVKAEIWGVRSIHGAIL